MNRELLIKKINDSGLTRKSIAYKMGISPNSLQNKLTGKYEFTYTETIMLTQILRLIESEYLDIFLPNMFAQCTQGGFFMRTHGNYHFPVLRRSYGSLEAIGKTINRKETYVSLRVCGKKEFTEDEKEMLSEKVGIEPEILFSEAV